jgi:vacuolar-type H+-ATPase subunit D/Vma8
MDKEFLRLDATFQELETKINKLNENAIRDRKFDLSVMTHDELKRTLESKIGKRTKIRVLLTQIGFLRINIFNECYKRIQLAETNQKFDEAIKIMNDYVDTVAMQFIQERLHPSLTNRIINSLSKSKIPDATKTLDEWKRLIATWSEDKFTPIDKDKDKKDREYPKMKELFITLDMLSFSFDNFPPLATDPAH